MAATPKTVCIIGAGPSGLAAAKNLKQSNFHVTVLEASSRIGGLWPLEKEDDGLVNPNMCTNQSRHTVSFSDLAWEESSPQFPKAWQVGQYLERYRKLYGVDVSLKTRVVKTERDGERWKVWTKSGESEKEEVFDHLIVATGFFGKAKLPNVVEGSKAPVIHSSKVRDIKTVLQDGVNGAASGKNIVVVGGQMSGVETAASIAFQVSSAANSPDESGIPDAGEYRVIHIVQKPIWTMLPLFPNNPDIEVKDDDGQTTKEKNPAPNFLPLDLVSYNIGWRPPGPVVNTSGHITPEAAQLTHGFMETYIGTDQSDLGVPALSMTGSVRSEPPMLAFSDSYPEFVRHGKIKISEGKLSEVSTSSNTVKVTDPLGNKISLVNVAAVICATGFDASASLDFLPKDVLEELKFEPTDDSFPLALNVHAAATTKFPSLGFVGFYRSPYWGVMEMQARFLAKLWNGDEKAKEALAKDTSLDAVLNLRTDPRRAQFPMGDYAYLMESFAEILVIKRQEPEGSDGRTGIVLPFRYVYDDADEQQKSEAALALSIANRVFADSKSGKFVAGAVYRSMHGIWSLYRTIRSKISTFPSGTLIGTAEFHPRNPTDSEKDMEYLYLEEGDFSPSWGGTMRAKRSYVYHYTENTDKMDVWFTKADHKTADYFFHQLDFETEGKKEGPEEPWRAKSNHLCIKDMYDVEYAFYFKGAMIDRWTSKYTVKGPNKDYTIENEYTRPSPGE